MFAQEADDLTHATRYHVGSVGQEDCATRFTGMTKPQLLDYLVTLGVFIIGELALSINLEVI